MTVMYIYIDRLSREDDKSLWIPAFLPADAAHQALQAGAGMTDLQGQALKDLNPYKA